MFRRLDAEPDVEEQFLDDPGAILTKEIGWSGPKQQVSSDNGLLVGALRSPSSRTRLREAQKAALAEPLRATIFSMSSSSSSSATFSSSSVSTSSASVGSSTTFTTGGVDCGSGSETDPAGLRFRIRDFLSRDDR